MEDFKSQIIKLLEENARYTLSQLSAMTDKSEEEVENAIAELEKDGVIVKYSAIIDTEKFKTEKVEALIEIKVVPQKLKGFDAFAEEIYTFKEVKSLYLMSGGFDLAVFVEGKNISELSKIVSEKLAVIDGVVSVQTHFILKKYKIEGQITKKSIVNDTRIIQA